MEGIIDIVATMNREPHRYHDLLPPIGTMDDQGRTFTEVAMHMANEGVLRMMRLSPVQICHLYDRGRISSLSGLQVWDVPMNNTYIFVAILVSRRSYWGKRDDIVHLLNSGYIPTAMDIYRYLMWMGPDALYGRIKDMYHPGATYRDIFLGTRYQRYLHMYATMHHIGTHSWRSIPDTLPTYDYGVSTNDTTIMGDPISSIPPTHIMEIHEGGARFLMSVGDVLACDRNPYTNTPFPEAIVRDAKIKREYLWRTGYPVDIPDMGDTISTPARIEMSLLASYLGISTDDVRANIYTIMTLCHMRGAEDAYSIDTLCMYMNYLIESKNEDIDTILLALEYMEDTEMIIIFQ